MAKQAKPQKISMTIKYTDLRSGPFQMAVAKMVQTPIADGAKRAHIHKLYKEVKKADDLVTTQFEKEVLPKYAKLDAKGKIEFSRKGDNSSYSIDPEKQEAYEEALNEFGQRPIEITMDYRPLTPATLSDVKLTVLESDSLGEFLVDQEGPGLPEALHAVK